MLDVAESDVASSRQPNPHASGNRCVFVSRGMSQHEPRKTFRLSWRLVLLLNRLLILMKVFALGASGQASCC